MAILFLISIKVSALNTSLILTFGYVQINQIAKVCKICHNKIINFFDKLLKTMTNNISLQEFLNPKNIIAVVGVSQDPQKYGHQVFFDLLRKGYQVYAVHPQDGEVNGQKRYKSLADLPVKPDVVSLVVPPEVSLKIARECVRLGIKKLWFQPGSENEEVLEYCRQNDLKILSGVCIMKKSEEM